LKNVTVKENNNGGIYCNLSNIDLLNVAVTDNSCYNGGGICGWYNCNINMQNVNITNNFANYGGGIYCKSDCNITLNNVTIKDNSASSGGGIYCEGSTLLFDSINLCNIHSNITGWRANDLYSDVVNNIILDTFSVLYPTRFYAEPMENFNFDILNGKTGQVDADVYVSPQGDNTNSGLTINDPFKTIHYAFSKIRADSLHQNTINLLEGTFGPSTNGEPLPVIMLDHLGISAEPQSNVILDANGQSDVLIFDSNTASYLTNVTITGGNEKGISVLNCDPELQDLTISINNDIGIYCNNSNPYIEDVFIANNGGSGIYCDQSGPVMNNVFITGNSAEFGGGINCNQSSPDMTNVTITGNSSVYEGGGLYLTESSPVFNSDNRCNIYMNNYPESKGLGADIYSLQNDLIHVVVDTFTVMSPTDYYASPVNKFTFDILHSINDNLINADLYVSVNGDNSNTGTSSDEPFKTIHYALSRIHADSLNPHTIHLLPGTYSTGTNGERFPLSLSNHVSLEGSGEGETVLDADSLHGVMRFLLVTNSTVSHITITNGYDLRGGGIYCYESSPVIKHIRVTGNYAYYDGGGVYCYKSNPTFENISISDNHGYDNGGGMFLDESNPLLNDVTFTGNTAANGGGLGCSSSSPVLTNVYITNNAASGVYMSAGGGLWCGWDSNPVLENVVITGNSASWDGGGIGCSFHSSLLLKNVIISNNTAMDRGGGIFLSWASSASLINCICWDDSPEEVRIDGNGFRSSDITISWSDIEGGQDGIVHNQNGIVNWLEGNLNINPLFTGTGEDPFALSEGSPCIDTGTPDTTGMNLPLRDLMGNYRLWDGNGDGDTIVDMGAYEFGALPVSVPEFRVPEFQVSGFGFQVEVCPNPADGIVDCRWLIVDGRRVTLKLLDIYGREIKTIRDETKSPGEFSVRMDVSDLPAGVYMVRVQADGQSAVRKLVVK
jgi:predicted outer membrane repeat protein